jgi:hypothetical protein
MVVLIYQPEGANMFSKNFSSFDNALLKEIKHGRNRFCQLCAKESGLLVLAQPYRVKDPWRGALPAKRVLEARLQALKQIGLIAWDGWQWKIL